MEITLLSTEAEARWCAALMAGSSPWIELNRGFDDSLAVVSDTNREVYVAREGDRLAGFIIVEMAGVLKGYIKSIAVDPSFRSTGVGQQLMRHAEARIFRETANVFLCVSSFNTRAQAFYERLGYTRVGVLENFVVAGKDEFIYRKTTGPLS